MERTSLYSAEEHNTTQVLCALYVHKFMHTKLCTHKFTSINFIMHCMMARLSLLHLAIILFEFELKWETIEVSPLVRHSYSVRDMLEQKPSVSLRI